MPPHATMARLRRAGHEDAVLDGVSPASLGDFGLIPSSLGGEGQGEGFGNVFAWLNIAV